MFNFHTNRIQFVVNSPITVRDNEIVRDMVNKLLGKIVRHLFLELWVLPNCRNFFLPLMEPSAGVIFYFGPLIIFLFV